MTAAHRLVLLCLLTLGASACAGAGTSPTPPTGALPASDHVHALRVADDGSLLLGLHGALWRGGPDGRDWSPLGLEGRDAMALGVAAEGQPLLVAGHGVLARSTDAGASFTLLEPDLPSLDVHALAQAPGDPDIAYAYVVGLGLVRSSDAGDTWVPTAGSGAQLPPDVVAMAVAPDDPGVVLVGSAGGGVLRSDDGGESFAWTSDQGSVGLAFGADGVVLSAGGGGIHASQDTGRTWDLAVAATELEGRPAGVAIGPDGTWWLVTEQPRVLYQDGGDGLEEVARA